MRYIIRNLIFTSIIGLFIILCFLFLNQTYIRSNNYDISIILLCGYAIIIIGIFLTINTSRNSIIRINTLNENAIKMLLLILMSIAIFIPSITFSDVIIAWENISLLNYFRGFVLLLSALFLPGACLFNIIFPNSTISHRLNVESFLVKITIYPIISLIFLGSVTLILDFFRFNQFNILIFLFFSIVFLFFIDVFIQKMYLNKLSFEIVNIKISRYTFLILFIGLGIIVIALGILLSSHHYILAGDRWRGISSASLIGTGNYGTSQDSYAKYWGCISFGLSALCGIPYINTNTLLFPFLYISITSIYLFTKAVLIRFDSKYSVLSSIFIAISFNPALLIFEFSYHTFAFITFFLSLTLFFTVIIPYNFKKSPMLKTKNIPLLLFSSLFLVQSFITYFIPALMGFLIIFIYIPFSSRIKQYFRDFLIFYAFFIIILAIFDLITLNFFSFWCFQGLSAFTGIPFNFYYVTPFSLRIILTALLFYSLSFSSLILFYFIHKVSNRLSKIITKIKVIVSRISKKKSNFFFIFIFIIFSTFLIISNQNSYSLIYYSSSSNLYLSFLNFYLNTLFISIGFFGILAIYFCYFVFKESRSLFYFLFFLVFIIIGLASCLIFLRGMQYPNYFVSDIPTNYVYYMNYCFSRTWYYSLIPISILFSIGLIKITNLIKKRKVRGGIFTSWRYYSFDNIKSITILFIIGFSIFISSLTPIAKLIYWDNYYTTTNEEAQIIGWSSKNIPYGSKILITTWQFRGEDLYLFETYYLQAEIKKVDNNISKLIDNLITQNIHYLILPEQWKDSYLALLDDFYSIKLYEYGSYIICRSIEI